MVVGQLIQINYGGKVIDGSSWEYGVVVAAYLNRTLIKRNHGGFTMHHENPVELEVTNVDGFRAIPLFHRNGKPVLLKKTMFGKYKFPNY